MIANYHRDIYLRKLFFYEIVNYSAVAQFPIRRRKFKIEKEKRTHQALAGSPLVEVFLHNCDQHQKNRLILNFFPLPLFLEKLTSTGGWGSEKVGHELTGGEGESKKRQKQLTGFMDVP